MKTCSCCKVEKPIDHFNKYKRAKDGLDYRCKGCQQESNKKWSQQNWDRKISQQRERRHHLQQQVRAYKASNGCACCLEQDEVCLDFHHLDPNAKEINPADMALQGWSWDRMLSEIQKCIVVCSNCHRKIHAGKIIL